MRDATAKAIYAALFEAQVAALNGRLDEEGVLVVPDAEELALELRSRPGSLAWGLECRVGGVLVERAGGRL